MTKRIRILDVSRRLASPWADRPLPSHTERARLPVGAYVKLLVDQAGGFVRPELIGVEITERTANGGYRGRTCSSPRRVAVRQGTELDFNASHVHGIWHAEREG